MYLYTTLATDTFKRANVNPLNNPPWSGGEGGIDPTEETHCQIINNECCPTQPAPYDSVATFTSIVWPNAQWAQIQCDVLNNLDGNQYSVIILAMRTNSGKDGYQGTHYNFEVDGPLGAACNVSVYSHINSAVQDIFLETTVALYAGDSIRGELFGDLISAYVMHNGAKIQILAPTVTPVGSIITSGNVGLQLYENEGGSASDAQVSNFIGGGIIKRPLTRS